VASPVSIEEREWRKMKKRKKEKEKEKEKGHQFSKRLFRLGQISILADCLIRVDRPWDCEEIQRERPCDLLSDSWNETFHSGCRDPKNPPSQPS